MKRGRKDDGNNDRIESAQQLFGRMQKKSQQLNIADDGDVADFTDFSDLELKPDHESRPMWVMPNGHIFLESTNPLYKSAYDFVVAIADPVSRPEFIQEYKISMLSLYAAVSVGKETDSILHVLERLSKTPLPHSVTKFIREMTNKFGKVKLVLKHENDEARWFVETTGPYAHLLHTLLANPELKACRMKREGETDDLKMIAVAADDDSYKEIGEELDGTKAADADSSEKAQARMLMRQRGYRPKHLPWDCAWFCKCQECVPYFARLGKQEDARLRANESALVLAEQVCRSHSPLLTELGVLELLALPSRPLPSPPLPSPLLPSPPLPSLPLPSLPFPRTRTLTGRPGVVLLQRREGGVLELEAKQEAGAKEAAQEKLLIGQGGGAGQGHPEQSLSIKIKIGGAAGGAGGAGGGGGASGAADGKVALLPGGGALADGRVMVEATSFEVDWLADWLAGLTASATQKGRPSSSSSSSSSSNH
jgi:hypothetical protein